MKRIKIGDNFYYIKYTEEAASEIIDKIIAWMEESSHYAAHSGEGIMQGDNCIIDAPELIADIIDNILKPEYIEEV